MVEQALKFQTIYRQSLEKINQWFQTKDWRPFDFQRRAWHAYLTGHSGLIHAATGIGKTYAAFLGPVIEALADNQTKNAAISVKTRKSKDQRVAKKSAPLKILWITPLRALASDIQQAIFEPLSYCEFDWPIGIRTGDTPASVRAKQRKQLPTILITTPESLSLLLSYPEAKTQFKHLDLVVVDEWHELMGSKRGVMTQLDISHLRNWCPSLKIWGLSATLGNTDAAMQVLLGDQAAAGKLIHGRNPKTIAIKSVEPPEIERFPWAGHMGLRLLPQVIQTIQDAGSTLVFTNTRSQTEIWYQAILEARPDWAGITALHHGSLDKKTRCFVESQLHRGNLKCVVCTSSLDLGVDFSPVDQVIQIGSPKGIARLMQRAGRSGHQPGEISRIVCVPTHALELLEFAAARQAIDSNTIEVRNPHNCPLDVLSQHLITLASGEGFSSEKIYKEVKTTYAYRDLKKKDFRWVLDFVTSGGQTLNAYAQYARVIRKNGRYLARDSEIVKRHRMNVGTITSDAAVAVKYINGHRLGMVEEKFVSKLQRGDCFVFSGQVLEYIKIKDMTLLVKKARNKKGPVPQWMGGRMPLSSQLADSVRHQLQLARKNTFNSTELSTIRPLLKLQAKWSLIPGQKEFLIERTKTREGFHIFFYPFEGYLIHEGLAALLAYRISKLKPITISMAVNDYGFELLSDEEIPLVQPIDKNLLASDKLLDDVLQSVNISEMARRQFREIARIAGLVFQGFPGRPKKSSQIQASSSLIFNVFKRYDPGNLLLKQATREVLEGQLEHHRLTAALTKLTSARIRIVDSEHPTPLAFPIMVNRMRAFVSSEKLSDRVRKMQMRLEGLADRSQRSASRIRNHTA
jgi:ATP-dependent Lhr-like helicase